MQKTKLKIVGLAVTPPPQTSLTYIQNFVGGEIERIQITKRYCFLVNDMAAITGMPINKEATKIYNSFHKTKKYIYGNALLIKTKIGGSEINDPSLQ